MLDSHRLSENKNETDLHRPERVNHSRIRLIDIFSTKGRKKEERISLYANLYPIMIEILGLISHVVIEWLADLTSCVTKICGGIDFRPSYMGGVLVVCITPRR